MMERLRGMGWAWVMMCFVMLGGCARHAAAESGGAAPADKTEENQAVTPPFAVKGDLSGLMLTWFDDKGPHTADKRDGIPEGSRDRVKVDFLNIAPEKRLDPEKVYVADVRVAGTGGAYAVKVVARDTFEKWIDERSGVAAKFAKEDALAKAPPSGVIIYRTSWCGVCKQAVAFFTERGIPFVEKDVEADASAAKEMRDKLAAAGVSGNGVPVIDFHGTIIQGFSRAQFESMLGQGAAPAAGGGSAPAPPSPPSGDLSHTI